MAGVAAILPIFQAVGTIFGAVMQSNAASNAGQAQADAANYNAAVARNNAIAAQQAAAADARQQELLNNQRLGTMEAQIAKSGVVFEGTPLMLLQDETAQGSLQKQKILHRGQVEANQFQSQATMDEFSGRQAKAAGSSRAGSTLLTGVISGADYGLKGFGIGG
jgi:hypothetical protein